MTRKVGKGVFRRVGAIALVLLVGCASGKTDAEKEAEKQAAARTKVTEDQCAEQVKLAATESEDPGIMMNCRFAGWDPVWNGKGIDATTEDYAARAGGGGGSSGGGSASSGSGDDSSAGGDPELLSLVREASIGVVDGCDETCSVITKVEVGFSTIHVFTTATGSAKIVCEMTTFNVAGRGDKVAVHIGTNASPAYEGDAGTACSPA